MKWPESVALAPLGPSAPLKIRLMHADDTAMEWAYLAFTGGSGSGKLKVMAAFMAFSELPEREIWRYRTQELFHCGSQLIQTELFRLRMFTDSMCQLADKWMRRTPFPVILSRNYSQNNVPRHINTQFRIWRNFASSKRFFRVLP